MRLVVNSTLDENVDVAVQKKAPNAMVYQRWLSKCADDLASEVLGVINGETVLPGKVRELYCALLDQRVNGILHNSSDADLSTRVTFIRSQVDAVRTGTHLQVGKLSDLRFASLFSAKKGDASRQPKMTLQTLPPVDVPMLDDTAAFERPLARRYNRNNQGKGRSILQEAISNTMVDEVSEAVKSLIEKSTIEDVVQHDTEGNNTVMLAAYCGHSKIVQAILQKHPGFDLEAANSEGETALTLAIKKRGFHHTLATLLDFGAEIPRRKAFERFCIDNGYRITAQILAKYGENSVEVDDTMTPEYVQFMYERVVASNGLLQHTRLLWSSKLYAVQRVATGTPLDAAELMAIGMFTNNAVVAEVRNKQLLQRQFSSVMVKNYVSVLHGALTKLQPFRGEVFLAADTDRKLFLKGREFTWNRFVSGSSLWRVALENAPSFTSKARKGCVFLIKSISGRIVGQYSQHSFDSEVVFLPSTRFQVSNWYHGDVIALGQENVREHSYGIDEVSPSERPSMQEMIHSDRRLIIELTEQN